MENSESRLIVAKDLYVSTRLTFPAYTMGMAAFIGSFFMVFYLGSGFVSLPLSFIVSFVDRPKNPAKQGWEIEKGQLQRQITTLLEKGKKLHKDRLDYDGV